METPGTPCNNIMTASDCELAAWQLNLADKTVTDDGQNDGENFDPPYCYFEGNSLKFNKRGKNTGPCTTDDKCVCIALAGSYLMKYTLKSEELTTSINELEFMAPNIIKYGLVICIYKIFF